MENGITLTIQPMPLAIMVLSLLIFGYLYDRFVGWLERRPHGHQGFTALLVMLGVAVTVTATLPLIGLEDYLVLVVAFLASGIPMITGSIVRYMRERDRQSEQLLGEVEGQL
jgi:MFS family permease